MKQLLIILLLTTLQNIVRADVRLDFRTDLANGQSRQLSYLVKNHRLRLDDGNKQRFNLFDSQQQQFISMNLQSGNISRIDKDILAQRVSQLNKKRLQRLKAILQEVEKKRSTMSDTELEVAESLATQLKYPHQYGAYTFNKIEAWGDLKTIAGIECQPYQVIQQKQLLTQFCLANRQQLGISASDFKTLLDYQEFNYQIESQIMLAMGEANFDLVSLRDNNIKKVIIEQLHVIKNTPSDRLRLQKISHINIENSLISLPKIKKLN